MGNLTEEQINQIQALNKLMIDYGKSQARIIIHLRNTIIALIISFTLILCVMIGSFFWYESQFEVVESYSTQLSTEGENANINSVVNGDQYNDSSTHNEE